MANERPVIALPATIASIALPATIVSIAIRAAFGVLAITSPWRVATAQGTPPQDISRWRELPPIPDPLGVAGPLAGAHDGTLLVAGGANFPDGPPWEGGMKVWHDTIYSLDLDRPGAKWEVAGRLPKRLGYAVTLSFPEGIACFGGSDSLRHHAESFWLRRGASKSGWTTSPLPPLPSLCANFCGAAIGRTIYLAGGTRTPTSTTALRNFWSLDLDQAAPRWREEEPWPGPARILGVAASDGKSFYLFSGAELSPGNDGKGNDGKGDDGKGDDGKAVRRYLRDAYRFTPGRGWQRLADLPRPAVAAPTPATLDAQGRVTIWGGDAGTDVGFHPPAAHPGFAKTALAYDPATDAWFESEGSPAGPVTTATVTWRNRLIIPTGEVRPGVRTPAVWSTDTQAAPSP